MSKGTTRNLESKRATRVRAIRPNVALALGLAVGLSGAGLAHGQNAAQRQAAPARPQAANDGAGSARMVRIPANPNDPVATINGEAITRNELSNACFERSGEEVLQTLINRKLIEQAMKTHKIEVSAAEVDAEIERVAMSMAGVSKETWLRELAKTKNISPIQYARDIIYPTLALRKLATPRVQITDQDVADALEEQFGDKLVYRMIMCRSLEHCKLLYEELKKNPGGFENLARNDPRSVDPATRADGGKPINGPLARHSYPRNVTDKIFVQLVDGDLDDKNPDHKPKDGDISGAIQVAEDMWVLVKREGIIPARPYKADDDDLKKQVRQTIFDTKIQERMEELFSELVSNSAIENKLTGSVKTADSELKPPVDGQVKLMSQQTESTGAGQAQEQKPVSSTTAAATAAATRGKLAAPRTVDPSDLETRSKAAVQPGAAGAK